ncbi:BadM/Rrf2 family transcriptional regulator [Novosphingobium sp. PhB165]|uniref:Rrf2 family transcriptional regulator n=1 Tax=Novosphingobium sp. PhB165 TaxID=2485105 RepID=UPI001048458B|nr:Rrf2 family transcriptional regulator [Novosphingobium sp. PhB165]TCM16598.1 BadM/Rrf2 family transcriptional regulator [Novosphingobium sp. PhB165]
MRGDSRLSRMLHVLLHMARHNTPFTSEQIAKMLGTNPVVVRRTMAGLREAGFVSSERGRGGGWSFVSDPTTITLLDVHRSVGATDVIALGSGDSDPACGVERVVNHALAEATGEAEAILLRRLGEVTLAELSTQLDAICKAEGWDDQHAPHQG